LRTIKRGELCSVCRRDIVQSRLLGHKLKDLSNNIGGNRRNLLRTIIT